ncbi:hypothetical protein [Jiella sp. M17.18]|uniref:hypothetical protein n=1 Tax=Jiella sp. M17.18 TaxID=3234247 RepID=UPI0034DE86ED
MTYDEPGFVGALGDRIDSKEGRGGVPARHRPHGPPEEAVAQIARLRRNAKNG